MRHDGETHTAIADFFGIFCAFAGLLAAGIAWPEPAASALAEQFRPAQIGVALGYAATGIVAGMVFWGLGRIVGHLGAIRAELAHARRRSEPPVHPPGDRWVLEADRRRAVNDLVAAGRERDAAASLPTGETSQLFGVRSPPPPR